MSHRGQGRRTEGDAEAVAPDGDAAEVGEVDGGRDLVVLVALVALELAQAHVLAVVEDGPAGGALLPRGIGERDAEVRAVAGVEVLQAEGVRAVGEADQFRRARGGVLVTDEGALREDGSEVILPFHFSWYEDSAS